MGQHPHLNCNITIVFSQLLIFNFLGRLLFYLVFWEDSDNLLVFRSCDLKSLTALQKNSVLELLQVLYFFLLLLLLHKPLLLGFLPCLGLSDLSYLLNSSLNKIGLSYLFQTGLELLLFFVPPLYLLMLLFKHLGIGLGNIGENERKHDNIEERWKNFLFYLCIVDLGTITGSFDKLNRTSKAQF